MDNTYWHYFLSLEQDFIKTSDYVEVCRGNLKTFSIRYLQLILSIGSEVDVVMKRICELINPKKKFKNSNMDEKRKVIVGKYPKFANIRISVIRYESLLIYPWEDWKKETNPDWWHAYNDLKHERNLYFGKANLSNTIHSLAGLFGVLLYLYKITESEEKLDPWSIVFDCDASPGNLQIESSLILPDFPESNVLEES